MHPLSHRFVPDAVELEYIAAVILSSLARCSRSLAPVVARWSYAGSLLHVKLQIDHRHFPIKWCATRNSCLGIESLVWREPSYGRLCAASCWAIRDLRRDHLRMWRRSIGCTVHITHQLAGELLKWENSFDNMLAARYNHPGSTSHPNPLPIWLILKPTFKPKLIYFGPRDLEKLVARLEV